MLCFYLNSKKVTLIFVLKAYDLTGVISPLVFKGFNKLESVQKFEWKNRLCSFTWFNYYISFSFLLD